MRLLYASCRYDPLDRDAGSGVDFNLAQTFEQLGCDLIFLGPVKDRPSTLEKIYRRVHRLFSRKLTAKFSESYLHHCARLLDEAVQQHSPDVIFSHNLIPLVHSKTDTPIIHKTDAVLSNTHQQWPTYSRLEYERMRRWEMKALKRCSLIVTASHWAEGALIKDYHIPAAKILVLPIPSSLPLDVMPSTIPARSISAQELHLLAVAKDPFMKGTDIAIETANILGSRGINATLRIVGQNGTDAPGIEYKGLYRKSDPDQLRAYVSHYLWAHVLIHPSRVESAGIVCSEAAAFGVPTITNATGGLATTVLDNVTGIVLPRGSAAAQYAQAIERLMANQEEYQRMRQQARQRYENELNWIAAGKRILEKFAVIREHKEV